MLGRRAGSPIAVYARVHTLPRAQNRTGKGSILLQRRFTFPIFLLLIYASVAAIPRYSDRKYRIVKKNQDRHGKLGRNLNSTESKLT